MVLLFLLDAIASTALYVTFKCGAWIVYNTATGVYYLYKKIKPSRTAGGDDCNTHAHIELMEVKCSSGDGIDDDDDVCVILSHEEYKKLKGE